MPCSTALPICNCCSENSSFWPRPEAPTREAMTAMASVCITTWLRPRSSVCCGGRQLDLPQRWRGVQPAIWPASTNVGGHGADAEDGAARHGRHGKADGRQHGRDLAEAEQDDDRTEIGHMRRRLQHVEDDIENALDAGIARRPDAEREAERRPRSGTVTMTSDKVCIASGHRPKIAR